MHFAMHISYKLCISLMISTCDRLSFRLISDSAIRSNCEFVFSGSQHLRSFFFSFLLSNVLVKSSDSLDSSPT